MGQKPLQDIWWWCVPVPGPLWIQPGVWLPRDLSGVFCSHQEERGGGESYCQPPGGHYQWPCIPPQQESGLRKRWHVSRNRLHEVISAVLFLLTKAIYFYNILLFLTVPTCQSTSQGCRWKEMQFTSNSSPKLASLFCGMGTMQSW